MKRNYSVILLVLCLQILFATLCHSQENDFLSDVKKVAEKKGKLIVCDKTLLDETISLSLSMFTEDLQMVKLDNANEALVDDDDVSISDNYILVRGGRRPCKLFEKKTGRFVADIGEIGQGPGKYQLINDQQLDEKNNRIYLLPWLSNKILVYDLKGNALESIPLRSDVPKGHFKVDTETGIVTVSALPFEDLQAVVWQQTVGGKLLRYVEPGHLSVSLDFSNDMAAYKTGNMYGFSIFTSRPREDSVYHYDVNQNKLIPVFTTDFKEERLVHGYIETDKYFMGDFSEAKKLDADKSTAPKQMYYIVDKRTLKGSFFTLENDYLGGMSVEWPIYALSGEYYSYNVEPDILREKLEKVLSDNDRMATEMRDKLTKLKDSISNDDNNYIFYAKFKK